jgi:hypothetical protein
VSKYGGRRSNSSALEVIYGVYWSQKPHLRPWCCKELGQLGYVIPCEVICCIKLTHRTEFCYWGYSGEAVKFVMLCNDSDTCQHCMLLNSLCDCDGKCLFVKDLKKKMQLPVSFCFDWCWLQFCLVWSGLLLCAPTITFFRRSHRSRSHVTMHSKCLKASIMIKCANAWIAP